MIILITITFSNRNFITVIIVCWLIPTMLWGRSRSFRSCLVLPSTYSAIGSNSRSLIYFFIFFERPIVFIIGVKYLFSILGFKWLTILIFAFSFTHLWIFGLVKGTSRFQHDWSFICGFQHLIQIILTDVFFLFRLTKQDRWMSYGVVGVLLTKLHWPYSIHSIHLWLQFSLVLGVGESSLFRFLYEIFR